METIHTQNKNLKNKRTDPEIHMSLDRILENLKADPLFYSQGSTTEEQYLSHEVRA